MRFFTMDWWRGVSQLSDDAPSADSRAHLATIRDKLPAGLLALQESVSLHDSHIRRMRYDHNASTLDVMLDGEDDKCGARRFNLRYKDIVSIETTSDPEVGLPGPHGYGNLGYDEADITPDGQLEHRMLFSSGIEMRIVFADFELAWDDAK